MDDGLPTSVGSAAIRAPSLVVFARLAPIFGAAVRTQVA
jgi:hypothetical protein